MVGDGDGDGGGGDDGSFQRMESTKSPSVGFGRLRVLYQDEEANESTALLDAVPPPPPLSKWIVPALSCAFAYAAYNIFIKVGSTHVFPVLGGVILQIVAALFGLVMLLAMLFYQRVVIVRKDQAPLQWNKWGILWSVFAGLSVGVAEILSFFVSGMGVPATQSIPIIIGGSVMFGTILGLVLLKESLSWHGWSGVVFLVVGIALVGTDPGNHTVANHHHKNHTT